MEPVKTWKITKAEYRFFKACALAGVAVLNDIDVQQKLLAVARRHRLPLDLQDISYFYRDFSARLGNAPIPYIQDLDTLEKHWLPMIAKEV